MAEIRVGNFLGIAPKVAEHLLKNEQAQTASDANLFAGSLRPFAGYLMREALSKTGNIQTLFPLSDGGWLHWAEDVDVVAGPVANDELEKHYFTGTDAPRVTYRDLFASSAFGESAPPASVLLGIPAPDEAPTVVTDGGGALSGGYAYVYTFVRTYPDGTSEEGPPSAPAEITLTDEKTTVTMSDGGVDDPEDYGITHKRLYRTSGGGEYFMVSEEIFATTSVSDNTAEEALGNALESTTYFGPPDGMRGLIALPNGVLAGFYRNTVYLSEPYKPHAYPLLNQYSVTGEIVGLGSVGTTILVLTKNRPHVGRGVDPASYTFVRQSHKYPCSSKRSIAMDEFGVAWASPLGMALWDGARMELVTREFIDRRDWASYYPNTIHGLFHEGRYYGWYSTGADSSGGLVGAGFILDRTERAFLSKLGSYSYAAASSPGSEILTVVRKDSVGGNRMYEFDGDTSSYTAFDWKSKVFISKALENFAYAKVHAKYSEGLTDAQLAALVTAAAAAVAFNAAVTNPTDGPVCSVMVGDDYEVCGETSLMEVPSTDGSSQTITFKLWQDGTLIYTKSVTSSVPFALPAGSSGERHEFSVSGEIEVLEVAVATSMEELASGS